MRGRFYILGLSMFSMAFQPVAYGQQQSNWAAQALKSYVQENQKGGKSLTVQEFWEKNAGNLDPYWQKKFYPTIKLQKNDKVPKMEIISIKGPQGQETARMMMNINGKTISVEMLGGQEKFMRVNNVVISYDDFYNVTPMMEKLGQDPVIAAETEKVRERALDSTLVPSYEVFKRMSAKTRAAYFVNLRLVLDAADKVMREARAREVAEATPAVPYLDLILEQAYASGGIKGTNCIVEGYVGAWTGKNKYDTFCDHEVGLQRAMGANVKQNNVQKAIAGACPSGSSPCNPFVFGFPPNNCISFVGSRKDKNSDFQRATSVCDQRSPLRTTDKKTLAADTQKMILTLLEKQKNESLEKLRKEYFNEDGKVISPEKYKELQDTVVADFNQFIDAGIATCKTDVEGKRLPDPHQGSACDVLAQRKLAFLQGIAELELTCKKEEKLENGKCVGAAVVATPAPVPAPPAAPAAPQPANTDPCGPLLAAGTATNEAKADGKQIDCNPVAAQLPVTKKAMAASKSSFDWKPVAALVAVFGALWWLFKKSAKSITTPPPKPADPITPPPLPAPPPQPGPITPVPPIAPITPVTPVTPPGSSETSPTAPPYNPGSGGSSR